ncbi:hypothetical protein BKA67DRAFT_696228 [Truncatella angustata]|uniref:Rhodopsin domain-containing protein n=1 Tax=Truncatella angustata TaxID=152316 RepID=A0A9P8RIB6_9PEZI|nr:uncharacterized protein BKA67DRAFT_696228 [Truncatella angustata]KAH6646364.1 hypothetical protein BKA67DRAFT_696228 [Truncatella angustata]KAH8195229.1 hypothetical protein TruAng_010612 [Truncatella angustata]
MPNLTWTPSSNSTSAFVGQPPNTQRDYYIVRGFLRGVGLGKTDAALGYTRASKPPYDGYTYTWKTPGIITGLSIVIAAIVAVTSTRLFLRASMSQMRFGADDWATIAAAAMGITYTVCQIIMATRGGGRHIWDLTYEDYNVFNYYGVIDKPIFYVTVGLVKISLTLFIRRLADRSHKAWRWFCDFFLVTLVLYIAAAIFWELFTCNPASAQWDKLYAGSLDTAAVCLPTLTQGKVLNITHVVQGVILLCSPMVILWTVRMDRHKKTRLFVMWGVGLIAVLCGLMRHLRADFTADVMWDYTELLIWTALDVCIGVIVISLPVMDAYIAGAWRSAVTRLGGRTYGGSKYGSSSNQKTPAASRYAHGTATSSTAPKKFSDSESIEQIIQKGHNSGGNDTELNTIVRTDEYNVQYSSARDSLDNEEQALKKVYNKQLSRTFSTT